MNSLHPAMLGTLGPAVALPRYDRAAVRPGIVHFGPGAFHRAHQAVYTDEAMGISGGDWGIIGVSLRSADVAHRLNPQGGLYSVLSQDGRERLLRVVGAIREVLFATEDPAAVMRAIADPDIAVLTLTVTEKGYSLGADGRSLDREDPLLQADLTDPLHPVTAVGMLALGLRERLAQGGAPLTVLSCDNLSANSTRLRGVLAEYLRDSFTEVLPWLDTSATFPCSVVDRIVPAMTDAGRAAQGALLGATDAGAVATEPFRQWLIEDRFAAGRPDWELAGAGIVADTGPYENIKLRLLNASHSAIAYCGLLAGKETVDEVIADDALRAFVERLMAADLMPSLDVPAGFDLCAYRDALLARFANPFLQHRCRQIAMDGSEKIGQRWLPTLRDARAPYLTRALSAWVYLVLATQIPIEDPRRSALLALRASSRPLGERIAGVLSCARIDAAHLARCPGIADDIERNLDFIRRRGIYQLLGAPVAG